MARAEDRLREWRVMLPAHSTLERLVTAEVTRALDFLPMVKKEMAEGPVPPRTAPFCVGNDKSFGRWRGKSLASVPPE